MKVLVLFAEGFEEVEGVTQVDFLRRAGVEVSTVSITDSKGVKGNFGITIQTEVTLGEINDEQYDMVVLPGGVKGMENLKANAKVTALLEKFYKEDKWVAAICASPTILGTIGLLEGKKAVCYPGFENGLIGATVVSDDVVVDGKIITSKGPGTSFQFALKLIEALCGKEVSDDIGRKTQMFK